jgi:hypothetical protein
LNTFHFGQEKKPGKPMENETIKTLRAREQELRSLLATPAGRLELEELTSRYHKASGKPSPPGSSAITYILVHERERGLIRN